MERKRYLKEGFSFKLIGFNQSLIDQLTPIFNNSILELSTLINVSSLEGISFTIGDEEYLQELKSFNDRLTPSSGAAIGSAMTLSHINQDYSRNYIIVNCRYLGLEYFLKEYTEPVSEEEISNIYNDFIHLLFHEFCHVLGYQEMLQISPELLTRDNFENDWEGFMHLTSLTCWDEYQVCSRANMIGSDQQDRYEAILLNVMNQFNASIDQIFKEYLSSVDGSRFSSLFNNTIRIIFDLFKYASYFLGDLSSKEGVSINDNISSHELYGTIERLDEILVSIKAKVESGTAEAYDFYRIGEYAQQVAVGLGLIVDPANDGSMFVNLSIPTKTRILCS